MNLSNEVKKEMRGLRYRQSVSVVYACMHTRGDTVRAPVTFPAAHGVESTVNDQSSVSTRNRIISKCPSIPKRVIKI